MAPSHRETKMAGGNDVGDWGEKDQTGAYAPGTSFSINGKPFDPAAAPAVSSADEPVGKQRVRLAPPGTP